MDANQELAPLKITCTSTRCQDNLHCFRLTQRQRREGPAGRCRTCGIELVDWKRVHRQRYEMPNTQWQLFNSSSSVTTSGTSR